jgi:hypothetical protein
MTEAMTEDEAADAAEVPNDDGDPPAPQGPHGVMDTEFDATDNPDWILGEDEADL